MKISCRVWNGDVLPFEPRHAYEILDRNVREQDTQLSSYPDWDEHVRRWAKHPAYTLIIDGQVVGCAGVVIFAKGRGEAWALLSSLFYRHKKTAYRAIREGLGKIIDERKLYRVQGLVKPDLEAAKNFIKHLGFQEEGLLRRYGLNGEDLIMFARTGEADG